MTHINAFYLEVSEKEQEVAKAKHELEAAEARLQQELDSQGLKDQRQPKGESKPKAKPKAKAKAKAKPKSK